MIYKSHLTERNVVVQTARYDGPGRCELHAVLLPDRNLGFDGQLDSLCDALGRLRAEAGAAGMEEVWSRAACADIVNRREAVAASGIARSIVGQPPLGGEAVGLLCSFRTGGAAGEIHYMAEATLPEESSARDLLEAYSAMLRGKGLSLGDDCLRTWFFVRDIDRTYGNVVRGRNEVFAREGLTRDTHYIASTGIGAATGSPSVPMVFEAIAAGGLQPGQVRYLKASHRMNDTMDYGVAFERGTAVTYGDRRVVYVSGTASIDNRGAIVAPGDVVAQTRRMCGNVDALLEEGGAAASDLLHIVLYLRNWSDAQRVLPIVGEAYPGVPCLAVEAPVCRPGWLVEMECIAMTPLSSDSPLTPYAPY